VIDLNDFFEAISGTKLEAFAADFKQALELRFYQRPHGELTEWIHTLDQLPAVTADQILLDQEAVTLGSSQAISESERDLIYQALMMLHPWRKGPFELMGIRIDTEWRSNLKWSRVEPHISPLQDRLVLDVGCGNLYYGWRMLVHQPRLVVGIDPSQKFMMQYQIMKRFAPSLLLHYLPLRDEDLPGRMQCFDTLFSMGVLYHRRSPFDHLEQLRQCLRPGGELILETLVIEGGANPVLVPRDRYAQMPNVWFIPSCDTLCQWLERAGFKNPGVVDLSHTGVDEQRSTDWMRFQSLSDYLDPHNPSLTIEGYPAPLRATLIAEA